MCIDYTYCKKECDDMACKHNKRHLDHLVIGDKKIVTAISWSYFVECEKGRYTND